MYLLSWGSMGCVVMYVLEYIQYVFFYGREGGGGAILFVTRLYVSEKREKRRHSNENWFSFLPARVSPAHFFGSVHDLTIS